jgi:hypothetical protein
MVLVISWILEREYRRHRMLDDELPATYAKWQALADARLQRDPGDIRPRIVRVVIHPDEIETWANNTGRQVNEQARSDYADLMWQKERDNWRAGSVNARIGAQVKRRALALSPDLARA